MKHLHVAVGIIRNAQGEIFITQRRADSHMAGFWEFPGGKIEQRETPEQALYRELLEEVGIQIKRPMLLDIFDYSYGDRLVTLHFYLVEKWSGEPFGREEQPARWVKQGQLCAEEFPKANAHLIKMLIAQADNNVLA